jgi:hypothetical protein
LKGLIKSISNPAANRSKAQRISSATVYIQRCLKKIIVS